MSLTNNDTRPGAIQGVYRYLFAVSSNERTGYSVQLSQISHGYRPVLLPKSRRSGKLALFQEQ